VADKKLKIHRFIRWSIQFVFLGLFVFFFLQTRFSMPIRLQNIFLRIDPLVLFITSIALRTLMTSFLFGIIILVTSLFFGRFFCGFVCPLGVMIDIADKLVIRTRSITKPSFLKNAKLAVLLFLIISALIGVSFLHFFDPLVIMERSLTLLLYPVLSFFASQVFLIPSAVFTETMIALCSFLMILGLGFIAPRFWCRNLCPLGALLSLFSRISIFKFTLVDGCKECGICEKVCPTQAIDIGNKKIDPAECITCLRCLYECPHQTIVYKTNIKPGRIDVKKREFITSIAAGIIAVPLASSFLHRKLSGRLIRPPGALPEKDFLNACLHCGMCMKICPTNGLQPCILESGINGLWTPKLVPRIGGCEKNCNKCGQVCPTGAIRKLTLEEKTYAKMGTAVIDKSRCIAWEQDKVCLICDEACPFNAIGSFNETIQGKTLLRPFVDERICTGCGLCEARCPIDGSAAIQVFSINEERKTRGSYITKEKQKLRACGEKPEDIPSGFISE
jgi:MauM/NapG family ferredoxin protein